MGTDVNGRSGCSLRASLHTAAVNAASDVLSTLLASGASVNIVDANGCSPMHLAAEMGTPAHQEAIRALAAMGADVNATSSSKRTPLHFAATGGPAFRPSKHGTEADAEGTMDTLIGSASSASPTAHGPSAPAATDAAVPSNSNQADALAEEADREAGDQFLAQTGRSATSQSGRKASAVSGGSSSDGGAATIALLVRLGARVEAADEEGNTPLMVAAKRGNYRAVDTLLTLGANIYAQNIRGQTCLHMATFQRRLPVIRLLCRWDAEVGRLKHILDNSGRSAYDLAPDSETREALHTLFEVCAFSRLDTVMKVYSINSMVASGIGKGEGHPWLPVRPGEVTRVLRRSCIHTAISGSARTLALFSAKQREMAAATSSGPGSPRAPSSPLASPARRRIGGAGSPPPSPSGSSLVAPRPIPRLSASSLHTISGIGFRFLPVLSRPITVALSKGALKCRWGQVPTSDLELGFPEFYAEKEENLFVDPYAYTRNESYKEVKKSKEAPRDGVSHTSSSATSARYEPGTEVTTALPEKECGRIISFLVRNGCDVDARDIDGVTPLMLACRYGLLYVMRKLLQYRADPLAKDSEGNIALHYAYAFGNNVAAQLLVDLVGAVPLDELRNTAGKTPLETAGEGMFILPNNSEKLVLVQHPIKRSLTLQVSKLEF
jgi:ankyrin repeat protein